MEIYPSPLGLTQYQAVRGHPDRPRCLQLLLQLEGHLLTCHPALMVQLGEVHLGQLPRGRARGLGVQEVVEDDAVQRRLQPDLHGAGQRPVDAPAMADGRRDPRSPSDAGPATSVASSPGPPRPCRPPPGRPPRTSDRRPGCCSSPLASHMAPPCLLGWSVANTATTSEAKTVREFSVPASFEVEEHDNIVSSVYAHERERPRPRDLPAPRRRRLDGCDGRAGSRTDSFGRTRLDRRGCRAR